MRERRTTTAPPLPILRTITKTVFPVASNHFDAKMKKSVVGISKIKFDSFSTVEIGLFLAIRCVESLKRICK